MVRVRVRVRKGVGSAVGCGRFVYFGFLKLYF